MDQEKIGNLIKELRTKNNLTQKQFADKYNVTYQAVSKWENGKNLPDVTLLRQISKDFNVNIDDVLEGKITKKTKSHKALYILGIITLILITLTILIIHLSKDKYEFKTLTTNYNGFKVQGSIAYNRNNSSIYISKIEYEEQALYKYIECSIYETYDNTDTKLDTKIFDKDVLVNLNDYLNTLSFKIDNYARTCKRYEDSSIFIYINAIDNNDKQVSYKIPLNIDEDC